MTTWTLWFDSIGMDDVPTVGGKNASLGEMRRALTPLGIRTPDGFATTADAYLVAHLFDERNEAVKRTIAQVIHAAQSAGRKIGICGQAPSDYPEFARFLVAEGIDSISLNPDSVLKTMLAIADLERTAGQDASASSRGETPAAALQPGDATGQAAGPTATR